MNFGVLCFYGFRSFSLFIFFVIENYQLPISQTMINECYGNKLMNFSHILKISLKGKKI